MSRGRGRTLPIVVGTVALAAWSSGCLPEVETTPTSTLPAVIPSTTLVPIELGGSPNDGAADDVAEFTGVTLDGSEHTLRSDDPNVPFVGDEPAEIQRINGLAMDGDCEQLRDTLEFWLSFVDDEPDDEQDTGPAVGDVEGAEASGADTSNASSRSSSRRASLFARAAFDAIAFIQCGAPPATSP
jgi:hypothetical protein